MIISGYDRCSFSNRLLAETFLELYLHKYVPKLYLLPFYRIVQAVYSKEHRPIHLLFIFNAQYFDSVHRKEIYLPLNSCIWKYDAIKKPNKHQVNSLKKKFYAE